MNANYELKFGMSLDGKINYLDVEDYLKVIPEFRRYGVTHVYANDACTYFDMTDSPVNICP